MKSSIRINKDGNKVHATGNAANELFKAMVTNVEKKKDVRLIEHIGKCPLCGYSISKESDICGECACEDDGI